MPVHDWSKVDAGIFHAFHHDWITELSRTLNGGVLPKDYYALPEQFAGRFGPDVLTLRRPDVDVPDPLDFPGGVALAESPPQVSVRMTSDSGRYAAKAKSVVVRHVSGHQVVALLEIVSPGNKSSRNALQSFVRKAHEAIASGVHLLIIDLIPPGPRDPEGIHGAIWEDVDDEVFELPGNKPLTCVSYLSSIAPEAFVEPIGYDQPLPEMPLFLTPETYVSIGLEATYEAAWKSMPHYWRGILTSDVRVGRASDFDEAD